MFLQVLPVVRRRYLSSLLRLRLANSLCFRPMTTASNSVRSQLTLPTLSRLQSTIPEDVSPAAVATQWLNNFSTAVSSKNAQAIDSLFVEDAFWRDVLALSWDYRSVQGSPRIRSFFDACVGSAGLSISAIAQDPYRSPVLRSPFPGLSWVQFGFDLETSIGKGQGFVRVVPMPNGEWKAYTMFTTLESLADSKDSPTRSPFQEKHWLDRRQREIDFADGDPSVLVIGAGHSGLELAARLGQLNVSTLVVDKTPRVGDNWRNRYDSLCLHDPVWYDQLPYLPYPSTWPVYTSRPKLADWLESYAQSLEINVWTSSNVENARWLSDQQTWDVSVVRDGKKRNMHIKHLIFATGMGGGVPVMPEIPGKDKFRGEILHSSTFHSSKPYRGKKVLVVGAGNSAHDIAQDLAETGVDVTMLQRSSTFVISAKAVAAMLSSVYSENGPPTEVADRLNASFPIAMVKMIHQRVTAGMAATIDKELHEKLRGAGFQINMGPDGAGLMQLFLRRGGGYYVDVGASSMIAEGKIGLKSGTEIKEYTANGVKFADGSELEADAVVFATGFGDPRGLARDLCGADVADKLHPVWGLDEESELRSVWRDSGYPRLHFVAGNFAISRLYSHFLALQLKAEDDGVAPERYAQ